MEFPIVNVVFCSNRELLKDFSKGTFEQRIVDMKQMPKKRRIPYAARLCEELKAIPSSMASEEGCPAIRFVDNLIDKIGLDKTLMVCSLRETLDGDESLSNHVEEMGITAVITLGFTMWPDLFRKYLTQQARTMTDKRIVIKESSFFRAVFGIGASYYHIHSHRRKVTVRSKFYQIIAAELRRQVVALPNSNDAEMARNSDCWTMFWAEGGEKGLTVRSAKYDFSLIKSPYFRSALKYYLRENRWRKRRKSFRSENNITMLPRVFNYLSDELGVVTPAGIQQTHVRQLLQYLCTEALSEKGKSLTLSSIRSHFKPLNMMFDWLVRPDVKPPAGQQKVVRNLFRAVSFKHEERFSKSTDYIPEEVVRQLMLHRAELPPIVNRCLTVMMETGLRFQNCVLLEEGCLAYDADIEMHVLRFVDYKVLKNRLKRGMSPYHQIGIKNLDTVAAIFEQEAESADLRELAGTKHFFVRNHSEQSTKVNILSATGFLVPIRQLIAKHQITDHDGHLWHFTGHQCRKTVAVTMIDNDASPIEVRNFLGHLDQKTTDAHYSEVSKKRLAELNHEFFEKKFKTKVSEEQLAKFSEKERWILYSEFALGYRDVELGKCIKHVSEGPCGKRKGQTNCATCSRICTGPQFEPKWRKLVEDAERDIAEMKEAYRKHRIPELDYRKYVEYKKKCGELAAYLSGLDKILEWKG